MGACFSYTFSLEKEETVPRTGQHVLGKRNNPPISASFLSRSQLFVSTRFQFNFDYCSFFFQGIEIKPSRRFCPLKRATADETKVPGHFEVRSRRAHLPIRSSSNWLSAWPGRRRKLISVVTLAGENCIKWRIRCRCGCPFSPLPSFSFPSWPYKKKEESTFQLASVHAGNSTILDVQSMLTSLSLFSLIVSDELWVKKFHATALSWNFFFFSRASTWRFIESVREYTQQ